MQLETFKKLAKSAVIDHWERKLRGEAALLPPVVYFKPQYYSLQKTHPILWTPKENPYEVTKAVIQLKMLSGRYRVAMLTRHWSPNRSCDCPAPECPDPETLEHLLLFCRYYDQSRLKLRRLWESISDPSQVTCSQRCWMGHLQFQFSLYLMPLHIPQ